MSELFLVDGQFEIFLCFTARPTSPPTVARWERYEDSSTAWWRSFASTEQPTWPSPSTLDERWLEAVLKGRGLPDPRASTVQASSEVAASPNGLETSGRATPAK